MQHSDESSSEEMSDGPFQSGKIEVIGGFHLSESDYQSHLTTAVRAFDIDDIVSLNGKIIGQYCYEHSSGELFVRLYVEGQLRSWYKVPKDENPIELDQ